MRSKPAIFSKVFKFMIMVIIALFLTYSLITIGVPKWLTFLIIVVLYLLYTAVLPAHIIYRTKSIAQVDRYIKNNSRQTIFEYPHALKEGNPEKIEASLIKIINEFREMESLYGAHLSAHQKDSTKMLEHAEGIQDLDYKNYYMSLAYILKGFYGEAEEYERKVEVPWMVHALKAYAAKKRGETIVFEEQAIASIQSARGIQRFTTYYTMKDLAGINHQFLATIK